jgi:Mn2+/Fe2+ NRAMP family transporter
VILWFMLVTSAATLGVHRESVVTAQDAARALRPLAGRLDADLFAAGLITSAVIALPVLMATTAHVVGTNFDWQRGISQNVNRAWRFYVILAASIGLAVAVDLTGISVVDMLVAASVIGGLGTPIGMVLLVRLARNPQIMNNQPISARLAILGWMVAVVVGALGLVYVVWGILSLF